METDGEQGDGEKKGETNRREEQRDEQREKLSSESE